MSRRLLIPFLFTLTFLPNLSEAQRWKRMRYETVYGIGATNFLGELGGANQIGTNYFKDLDIAMTKYVLNAGVRYRVNTWLSVKGSLSYGVVSGDDKLTKEESRNYRNLSFKSSITELSLQIEPAIIKEQTGARYRLRGVKGRKSFGINTYPFIGIAAFYFNPKAKYKGKWYALQPLTTEGQGQLPTRKKYSRFGVSIPLGIGFKYGYNRRWSVAFEYGIRKTFTDYIDDVSMTYVDEEVITQGASNKSVAVALADRSDGTIPGKTTPGQQRGDPRDKDTYMFAIVSLNYKFRLAKISRKSRPKF